MKTTDSAINPGLYVAIFTMGWHPAVVVKFVCLNDPESCAGGDFGPWQV